MRIFFENPNLLIQEFNKMAATSQKKAYITVGIELQKVEIETLINYRKELNELKKSFVEKGWENEANLVYCIDNSLLAVQHELQMLVNIKEDNMDEAWRNLINAQIIYSVVMVNSPAEFSSPNGYIERLEAYEKLLFPKMYFQSVGGIVRKSHCSICGENYNKCDHIKGRLYNGELCCRVITEMEMEEISSVENPANKLCRVLSIQEAGKSVDLMTLRESDDNSSLENLPSIK